MYSRPTLAAILMLAHVLVAAAAPARPRLLVTLKQQADLTDVTGSCTAVVGRLMSHANACQPAVCKVVEKLGGKVLTRLWANNTLVVELPDAARLELARHPTIRSVRRSRRIRLPRVARVGPGRASSAPAWGLPKIGAPALWASGVDGSGVVVGHIDTGVDGAHPELSGKILDFRDFVDPANTTARDGQGHGTHTAGTIAGTRTGVAPGAKLVVARVLTEEGATEDALMAAMQWMMDPDGDPRTDDAPRICSNSWGSDDGTDSGFWEITEAWRAAGILPVFAVGNAGPAAGTGGTPGTYPHVFAVGATTRIDRAATFSSRGPARWDGRVLVKPDVSAPGEDIVSLRDGGGYVPLSGTSMACPHVAGLAALLLAARPEATPDALIRAIETTAVELGAPGRDNVFGTGRVDGPRALAALQAEPIESAVSARPAHRSRIFRTLYGIR